VTDTLTLVPNGGWDERILVCRCGTLVDVFVIVTTRYVVLVDTLLGPDTAGALFAFAAPYLVGRQLLVVNTHADWDHAWGNQVFVGPTAAYHAPVIATRLCAERLRSDEAHARLVQMRADEPGRFDATELVAPTILFEDRLVINGGDLTLELFATPGHQPDHCSIWIPAIEMLLAGDAAEAPFPFALSAAALPQMRASLAQMAALNPQHVLYCHAPVTAGPALLHANNAYFAELEEHCRAALAAGASASPAADADVEALIGLPFEQALPMPTDQPDFYRPGHLAHIRMMLVWCQEH
jgi:glyoxylase-like metal-dependent hydrolase (beta-lactamase superfamily II)